MLCTDTHASAKFWHKKTCDTFCFVAGILEDTRLYENIVKVARGNKYVIYGDPTYPLKPLLLKPYRGACLQPYQAHFNKCMSTVRQAVELGIGKVAADFAL